ncbi:MAG: hypothetical protein KDK64_06075, partial [Chlamydiia bacterium]|nr:hypothetical protein [Chlamydiia bacterium]
MENTRKFNLTVENPAVQQLIDQYNRSTYVNTQRRNIGVCGKAAELSSIASKLLSATAEESDQRVLKQLAQKVCEAFERITEDFCTTYKDLPRKTLVACHVSQKHTETLTEALSVRDKLQEHFNIPTGQKTPDLLGFEHPLDPSYCLRLHLTKIHKTLPFRFSLLADLLGVPSEIEIDPLLLPPAPKVYDFTPKKVLVAATSCKGAAARWQQDCLRPHPYTTIHNG